MKAKVATAPLATGADAVKAFAMLAALVAFLMATGLTHWGF